MVRRSSGEGTICKRSDGKWTGAVQVAGRRYWVYGDTRKEVAQKLDGLKRQEDQGTLSPSSRLTVAEYLGNWLDYAHLNRKPSTTHGYEDVVRGHLVPALGSFKLQKLTPQHLVKLYGDKQGEGLSPRRVAIIHAVLHTALEEAVRWRLVPRNVAADVRPPRQDRPRAPRVEPGRTTAVRGHG